MALHYIEAANSKKMAADAMHKLMNENRTRINFSHERGVTRVIS
jgi:hypothetical protein